MTLKELKERFEKTAKAKKERLAEIDRLKAELAKTEEEMLAAADRGDLNKYTELENQKRALDARIFVYERSLPGAGNPVTKEEAATAWESFAKTYNKDTEAQYKAFLADCRALAIKYKKLVEVQNAALYEREKALQIMGESRISDALTMYMIPCNPGEAYAGWKRRTTSAEIPFFVALGMITNEEAENFMQIVEGGFSTEM